MKDSYTYLYKGSISVRDGGRNVIVRASSVTLQEYPVNKVSCGYTTWTISGHREGSCGVPEKFFS